MATAAVELVPLEPAALTVEQAARYVGMSVSWLNHSDVPRVRLGRAVRYLKTDLDAYLTQRRDMDV